LAITIIQSILILAQWFICRTWIVFWLPQTPAFNIGLYAAFFLFTVSFVFSALLGFRYSNRFISLFYKLAATWLGFLNYFFLAAILCRLIALAYRFADVPAPRPLIAGTLFGLAVLISIYGLFNAQRVRVHRVPIHLENLPTSWHGRTAVLFSDLHLGNINALAFGRRIVRLANSLHPDIVFIPGDFFDGVKTDNLRMAAPFRELAAPLGIYFATGNHDEYGDLTHYLEAIAHAGIRILNNEKVTVDGLAILGVAYHESTHILHMRATLERLHTNPAEPAILLNHVPNRLPIAEQAGISLQLSGHTHGGQCFPFTWITRRAFGKFTYGLQRFGALQVYTSCGAGTWGPPMRVGTRPEIVLLRFE
jgi:predicted MPP superfamily phosphohydrolase